MVLEALENRTLLSIDPAVSLRAISPISTLIASANPRDLVFDSTRNQIILAKADRIERFDASTLQLISTLPIPASSIDITPDGKFLYAANGSAQVHKINLATGVDTPILVGTSLTDDLFSDVAISDSSAIISQQINFTHPQDHLRSISLQSDAVSDVLFNSAPLQPPETLFLARSTDYHHTFMIGNNYDYQLGGAGLDSRAYGEIDNVAVSRDGALHAISTPSSLLILNSNFDIVARGNNFFYAGIAFDPVRDVLYALDPASDQIFAFNTNTWATLYKLPVGEGIFRASPQGPGNLTLSSDGNSLFILTNSGVRVFQPNITFGSALLFVAEVSSPSAPAPTGQVNFFDTTTNTPLGQASIENGAALLTLTTLHGGQHSITASYLGDDAYNPLTSAPITISISRAATTAKVEVNGSSAFVTIMSTKGTPNAGQVDLFEDSTKLDSAQIHSGTATLLLPEFGRHSLRVAYSGSDDFLPSTQSFSAHTLGHYNLTLTTPSSAPYGQLIALDADYGHPLATGTVTYLDGQTVLGSSQMAAGHATFGTRLLPGPHNLMASYAGDDNFFQSQAFHSIVIGPEPTTLKLTTLAPSLPLGVAVPFTATISAQSTVLTSGTITFKEGKRKIGTGNIADGKATFTRALSLGIHSITASYQGNSLQSSSVSNTLKVKVLKPITIDLLALYTPRALTTIGSATGMRQHINYAVADTNIAFINSRISVIMRVVRIQQIAYRESGKFQTDLTRLLRPHDGYLDSIHQLRNKYRADLVTLFEGAGDLGGIAYALRNLRDSSNADFGFSVVLSQQAGGPTFSLAHELGHNLGATHDAEHREGRGLTAYSNGWRFQGNDGVLYHDIMSYDPGETIQYFSNPSLTYQGVPIGSSTANASRTISLAAPLVARYR